MLPTVVTDERTAVAYRDRFADDAVADHYDHEVYAPGSHSSEIWTQQQSLVATVLSRCRQHGERLSLLDFACGSGRVLHFAEDLVDESVGIDVSPAMLDRARRRCRRATLVQGDLLSATPLGTRTFDVVTAFRFFVNAEPDSRALALAALRRHVTDGGTLIANIHGNRRSIRHLAVALRRRRPRADVPPEMLNEMGAAEFVALCEGAGFSVEEVHGFGLVLPRAYDTPVGALARWVDRRLADGRLARRAGIDLVFVCRARPSGDADRSPRGRGRGAGRGDEPGAAVSGGDTHQPLNLAKRIDILCDHLPPGARRILDGGCGRGGYVAALRKRTGLAAYGVEHQAGKMADECLPEARGSVVRGDLERLGVRDGWFDAAFLNEVLEHVPSDEQALREVHRVLRPGGRLVVMSPNRLFPFESHGVFLRRSGRAVPVWVPFVPYVPLAAGRRVFSYWARNYWPRELRHLVEDAGFRIVETGFVWQTFEGISRHQPRLLRALRPIARALCNRLERTPVVRRFGISQLIVAEAIPAG